ncbi:phage tail protein [Paenibacillus dendritiformis]|uniref:phage tail-collar fiber domain-containing protein n=1 Tax=Paenibacillus dendritiformis TaxID=130049 RepID=UPI00248C4046|nr:phage tail protein [Paenibacillus dendritiformis]WGU94609.1 phage tail protein [Paenibacillus dendritiformis]
MATARTLEYRGKMARAVAGLNPMVQITHIAIGTGGIGADGTPKPLTGKETGLFQEVYRKPVKATMADATTVRYSLALKAGKDGLADMGINEIALFDADGALAAIKTTTTKNLEATDELEFDFDALF